MTQFKDTTGLGDKMEVEVITAKDVGVLILPEETGNTVHDNDFLFHVGQEVKITGGRLGKIVGQDADGNFQVSYSATSTFKAEDLESAHVEPKQEK